MKLKRWGFAALCVLGMHCSQSPSPPPAGNTGGTSSGSSSMSGSGGTGSGTVGPGSGATVGGSGVTSVGSGSGDTSASGSGGGGDAGNCALGVQGISYSGCNACGLCWQQHCCQQSNACLNDTTCNGYLACQSTCYNGQAPDGAAIDVDAASIFPDGGTLADDCANNCLPPDAGPLWNVMQDCISPTCDTPCLCP